MDFQLGNGESGAINELPNELPQDLLIAVDATATGARVNLPERWDSACFDSRSWDGPAGLAIVAINNAAQWKNPLPHLDGRINPGPTSLPLIVASALAIDSWVADEKNLAEKIATINSDIRSYLKTNIPDCDLAPGGADHLISASFLYVNAEQLVTKLADKGYSVDSGSACSSINLKH